MTVPTYFDSGAGANTTGATLTCSYPATVAANDLALCHANIHENTDRDIAFPGDWNEVEDLFSTDLNSAWAWKRLAGTEGGTTFNVTGAPGGGIGFCGRVYVFRGCVTTGTPYESSATTQGLGTVSSTSAINTLSADRLAICLILVGDDDKTITAITGSNVTWSESVAEFVSASGLDQTMSCQQADVVFPTAVTAGTQSHGGGSDVWRTHTFALIPAAEVLPPRAGVTTFQNPGVI